MYVYVHGKVALGYDYSPGHELTAFADGAANKQTNIYIYIYTHVCVSLSLYIYIYVCI